MTDALQSEEVRAFLAGIEVRPATAQDWINATIGAPMLPVSHVRTDKVVKLVAPVPAEWELA